jgi:hypothetical protein
MTEQTLTDETDAPSGQETYRLRLPHWHADVLHPAGTVLRLYPAQIARIRAVEEAALHSEVTHG